MDKLDLKILTALQRDCRQSVAELGEKVSLSPSACHRRIRLLENGGFIEGYSARLDGKKVGYLIEFFIEVSLASQREETLRLFEDAVEEVPEILECHLMTGEADYLLRVGASDTSDYERIYRNRIAQLPGVSRIQSSLVLRTVKKWSGYVLKDNVNFLSHP